MLHDADIREPLFAYLEEVYGKIRIIEEKRIGRSRADIVMVTDGLFFGLEIKSDADSYARLETQVKDYDRYCDYNYAVVGSSHVKGIEGHVPEYWGIITVEEVEGEADFYTLRKPGVNPNVKLTNQLHIMWRPELVRIQERNEMPRYKEKSKDFVIEKIIERTQYPEDKKGHIDLQTLKLQITEELFERDYSMIAQEIAQFRAENHLKPRRKRKKRKWK